jgi:hypothetical protein
MEAPLMVDAARGDWLDLARQHLEVAIDLFLQGNRDPSAVALAGAAEDIYVRAIRERGGLDALAYQFAGFESSGISSIMYGPFSSTRKGQKAALVRLQNLAMSHVKHGTENRPPLSRHEQQVRTAPLDFRDAAPWLIVRALENGRAERRGAGKH